MHYIGLIQIRQFYFSVLRALGVRDERPLVMMAGKIVREPCDAALHLSVKQGSGGNINPITRFDVWLAQMTPFGKSPNQLRLWVSLVNLVMGPLRNRTKKTTKKIGRSDSRKSEMKKFPRRAGRSHGVTMSVKPLKNYKSPKACNRWSENVPKKPLVAIGCPPELEKKSPVRMPPSRGTRRFM